jgi:hypothetical protein
LQTQVTEDAFVLIHSDYTGQSVLSLEDADRAHGDARGTWLARGTLLPIHTDGNE